MSVMLTLNKFMPVVEIPSATSSKDIIAPLLGRASSTASNVSSSTHGNIRANVPSTGSESASMKISDMTNFGVVPCVASFPEMIMQQSSLANEFRNLYHFLIGLTLRISLTFANNFFIL